MYNFILICWKLNKIGEDDVRAFAAKGYISEEQAAQIISEPHGR